MTNGEGSTALTLLVVDDEPAWVGALGAVLGKAGHRIVAAYDGEEALRRFRAEPVDVVLLDLAMPGLDGAEVCRQIRAVSSVPIIIVSGERDRAAPSELLDLGADDYVRKGTPSNELLARIRAVLRRTGGSGTSVAPAAAGAAGTSTCAATRSAGAAASYPPRRSSSSCSPRWSSTLASSSRTPICLPPAGRTFPIPTRSGSSRTWPDCATSSTPSALRDRRRCAAWATDSTSSATEPRPTPNRPATNRPPSRR